MPDLQKEQNYIELLNMLKYLEIENKSKLNLMILLFERMFVSDGKLKNIHGEKEILDFISFCNMKTLPKKVKESPYLKTIMKLFKFIEIEEKELILINILMNSCNKPSIYFNIIDAIFSAKNEHYIRNENINLDNTEYTDFVKTVLNFFNNEFKKYEIKSNFTFVYQDNKFKIKFFTNDEIAKYILSNDKIKKLKLSDIKNYIGENIIKKEIISKKENKDNFIKENKNNNNKSENPKKQIEESKDKKIETREICAQKLNSEKRTEDLEKIIKEQNEEILRLKKEINELREKADEANLKAKEANLKVNEANLKANEANIKVNSTRNNMIRMESYFKKIINENNIKHSELTNNMKEEMEKLKNKINSLNMKINANENKIEKLNHQLINSEKEYQENIKRLNQELRNVQIINNKNSNELSLIKRRDTIKFIIDLLYMLIFKTPGFSCGYDEKIQKINKEIKLIAQDDKKEFALSISEFLSKIKDDKSLGDRFAHPEFIYDLTYDNKNIEKFLKNELEIKNYFSLFKKLYQIKNRDENITNIIQEINEMIINVNFLVEYIDCFTIFFTILSFCSIKYSSSKDILE